MNIKSIFNIFKKKKDNKINCKNCGKHIYNLIGNIDIQGEHPVYPPESFQPANSDIKQPKHGDKTICPYCNEQWHN